MPNTRSCVFLCPKKGDLKIMCNKNFEKGQYIVYTTNGLCYIEDIQYISFIKGEDAKMHYVIKPVRGNSSTIYIPSDNDKLISKIRPIMTQEELAALLSNIKSKSLTWENDRKIRAENFHDILISGVAEDLMLMISCIYSKKNSLLTAKKTLSSSDSKFFEQAKKLVEEEFAFVLGIKETEVEEYIRERLEK